MEYGLNSKHTPGARVESRDGGWRLEIPAGAVPPAYRLAQLDDYAHLSRGRFLHSAPWSLSLSARTSRPDLPGTWGFGLWNDPFGFSLGFGGRTRRLPALPNAAWFFHASAPNWLSVHAEIPGRGFFAGTIQSAHIPPILLAPAVLGLPMMRVRVLSRWVRRMAAGMLRQDARLVSVAVTEWHTYSIQWLHDVCEYFVDGRSILKTAFSPPAPLGLVIWIDNQYAAWEPDGRLAYGTLANPAAWLEIANLQLA